MVRPRARLRPTAHPAPRSNARHHRSRDLVRSGLGMSEQRHLQLRSWRRPLQKAPREAKMTLVAASWPPVCPVLLPARIVWMRQLVRSAVAVSQAVRDMPT